MLVGVPCIAGPWIDLTAVPTGDCLLTTFDRVAAWLRSTVEGRYVSKIVELGVEHEENLCVSCSIPSGKLQHGSATSAHGCVRQED